MAARAPISYLYGWPHIYQHDVYNVPCCRWNWKEILEKPLRKKNLNSQKLAAAYHIVHNKSRIRNWCTLFRFNQWVDCRYSKPHLPHVRLISRSHACSWESHAFLQIKVRPLLNGRQYRNDDKNWDRIKWIRRGKQTANESLNDFLVFL